MEWRCEWCGKPHDEKDPPCENCGHGSFERAVVPQAPPGGDGANTTSVWVCTECGRAHPKNSPPCSRCGNGTLELEERTVDDYEDIGAPGYRDLVTTRYAIGLVAALGLAAVFVLGVTGVVTIPGLTPTGLEVTDVPGEADEAGGIDLATVEERYLDLLNDARRDAGRDELVRDDSLQEVTTFLHQRTLKQRLGNGDLPSADPAAERLGETCSAEPAIWSLRASERPNIDDLDSAAVLGGLLAEGSRFGDEPLESGHTGKTGIDVHVGPDGQVYLLQFVC